MSLKALFCKWSLSKATIKSDIKRFWWVPAINLFILVFFMLPEAVSYVGDVKGWAENFSFNTDRGTLAIMFSIVLSGFMFSYLHRSASTSEMHSLPLTRKTQYLSHIFTAIVMLLIPIVIAVIVMYFEFISLESGEMFALKSVLQYFYTCGLYIITSVIVVGFAAMLTGNSSAMYLLTVGLILAPAYIDSLSDLICRTELFGYAKEGLKLSNIFYVLGSDMYTSKSLIYVALSVILFVLSLVLYEKRDLENYDELMAFDKLRNVCMYLLAIAFGSFGYGIAQSVWDIKIFFLGMMPFGIIALIAVFMINRKSFSFKGVFKHIAVYAIFVGVVQLIFTFDLTGFERRIPDINDVEAIELNEVYNGYSDFNSYTYDEDSRKEMNFYDVVPKPAITNTDEIENIINLHEQIINNKELDEKIMTIGKNVDFTYKLKNGKEIRRAYYIDLGNYSDDLLFYYGNDTYKKNTYPLLIEGDNIETICNSVTINTLTGSKSLVNKVDNDKLIEVLKKDFENLDPNYLIYSCNYVECIDVSYLKRLNQKGESYEFGGSITIPLSADFPNTKAYIESVTDIFKDRESLYADADRIDFSMSPAYEYGSQGGKEKMSCSIENSEDVKAFLGFLDNFRNSTYKELTANGNIEDITIEIINGGNTVKYINIRCSQNYLPMELLKRGNNVDTNPDVDTIAY